MFRNISTIVLLALFTGCNNQLEHFQLESTDASYIDNSISLTDSILSMADGKIHQIKHNQDSIYEVIEHDQKTINQLNYRLRIKTDYERELEELIDSLDVIIEVKDSLNSAYFDHLVKEEAKNNYLKFKIDSMDYQMEILKYELAYYLENQQEVFESILIDDVNPNQEATTGDSGSSDKKKWFKKQP